MFFPELPWDQPSTGCAEYVRWKSNDRWTTTTPWSKIDTLALSMLRKILDPNAAKRILLDKIISHKWCHMQFSNAGKCSIPDTIVIDNSFQAIRGHTLCWCRFVCGFCAGTEWLSAYFQSEGTLVPKQTLQFKRTCFAYFKSFYLYGFLTDFWALAL